MSNATQRNFGSLVRERDRRLGSMLDGSAPMGTMAVTGEPGWDAFFGAMHDNEEAANAAGLNYRVDLGSIGRPGYTLGAFGQPDGGVQYPSDANAAAKNQVLGAMSDENGFRQLANRAAVDTQQQSTIDAMHHSYNDQVAASVNAPPITDVVSKTVTPGQSDKYTINPRATDPRTQFLDRLPPAARLQYEQQMAAIDAARTGTALTVRKELAAEASNPLLTSFTDANGKPLQLSDANGAPLQGDAALAKLSPAVRNQVQGVLDGRQTLPTGTATKDPYWKSIIQIANQVDPSFDAVNYNARASTRKAFTSGKESGQINAISTAIGHLSDFSDAAEKLGNGSIDWMNAAKNKLTTGGSDRGVALNNFNTIKNGLTSELTRVWRQAGGTEQDIKDWSATIGDSKSPEELHGALNTIGTMLESKLTALEDQYRQGMGSNKVSIITPQARAHLDKIEGRANGAAAPGGGAVYARDPQGKLHQAPAGTALPSGWTQERR